MSAVLTLLLLAAVLLPSRPVHAAPTGLQLTSPFDWLASPCSGLYRAMADHGLNPDVPTLGVTYMERRPHVVLLPVLAAVATDPALWDNPALLRERMRQAVEAFYPGGVSASINQARQDINAALFPEPQTMGAYWVRATLNDPLLGPPWASVLTAGPLDPVTTSC